MKIGDLYVYKDLKPLKDPIEKMKDAFYRPFYAWREEVKPNEWTCALCERDHEVLGLPSVLDCPNCGTRMDILGDGQGEHIFTLVHIGQVDRLELLLLEE